MAYGWSKVSFASLFENLLLTSVHDMLYSFTINTYITCLVQNLRSRYQNLNKVLSKIRKKPFLNDLRPLTQHFRILGESVLVFNDLLGHQIVVLAFQMTVQLVEICYMLVHAANVTDSGYVYAVFSHCLVATFSSVL